MFRHKIIHAAVTASLLLAACSDDGSTTGPDDGAADDVSTTAVTSDDGATTTESTDAPTTTNLYPDGLRGVKYCEVLLLNADPDKGLVATVYNSMGYSTCPDDEWAELDPVAIAADFEALVALLNGPRYWTLDRIESSIRDGAPTETFGAITMFRAATVELGTAPPQMTPYLPAPVARETVFVFEAGSEIYELTAPDGRVFVMQSFSQQVDPTMGIERLAALGDVLQLPDGWTFSSRVLDEQLDVYSTEGIAMVMQDEFRNSYQFVDPAAAPAD